MHKRLQRTPANQHPFSWYFLLSSYLYFEAKKKKPRTKRKYFRAIISDISHCLLIIFNVLPQYLVVFATFHFVVISWRKVANFRFVFSPRNNDKRTKRQANNQTTKLLANLQLFVVVYLHVFCHLFYISFRCSFVISGRKVVN